MAIDCSEKMVIPDGEIASAGFRHGIWKETFCAAFFYRKRLGVLFLALATLKLQVVLFPFFFMAVLAPVSGLVVKAGTVLALYTGCAWGAVGAKVSWSRKKVLEFMFKALLLFLLLEVSGSWYFSPANSTMFGGELRLTELSQDNNSYELLLVLVAFLTKWLWELIIVVLLATGLPAALLARRQGFKRTFKRGYAAALYIVSRLFIGPIPVLSVALIWSVIITGVGAGMVRLNFDPSQKIEFLSYAVMLSLVSNTIVFWAYLMAGIVLSRAYQLGEARLAESNEQKSELTEAEAV